MGILSSLLPPKVKFFLNREYNCKYSDDKKTECLGYKLADIFDPIDD